ncbi:MAG: DUF1080 domain-containing protein, partial [Bryobacterales bacterium]|nr:DUF1080 domain-containing protein [Bryobacterales bacterium]
PRLLALLLPALLHAGFRPVDSWAHEGPRATFTVSQTGISTGGRAHIPNWLRSAAEYEDFRLRFEYNLAQWAEAAVFLRAPRTERPANAGLAIILAHDFHNQSTPFVTGAIAGVQPPLKLLPPSFAQWHKAEIACIGDSLTLHIDGVLLQEQNLAAHPALRHRLRRGYIGFPDMGHAYRVRSIEIEDLGRKHSIVELFETGIASAVRRGDSGHWQWDRGTLTGADGHSILYAPPAFQDFEFTAAVRTHGRVNSGVFLRGSPHPQRSRGFEIQIYSPPDAVYPTGSIYGQARSKLHADLEGRWFLLQILVQASQCRVSIDGLETASAPLPASALAQGQIGFQIHLEDSSVEFRDIRVRPLAP